MRVAVVGCAHGQVEMIANEVEKINANTTTNKIDLIICCGDFQGILNFECLLLYIYYYHLVHLRVCKFNNISLSQRR